MTRAMQVKQKQPIKPLIVPPVKAEEINCEELKKQKKSNELLRELWKHAEEKRVLSARTSVLTSTRWGKKSFTGSTLVTMQGRCWRLVRLLCQQRCVNQRWNWLMNR